MQFDVREMRTKLNVNEFIKQLISEILKIYQLVFHKKLPLCWEDKIQGILAMVAELNTILNLIFIKQ